MTKRIEILIVIVVLIVLALVFGCKDEAEALTIDPNDIFLSGDSVFMEIILTDEPNFAEGNTIVYEGDEFDIVIEKKEPNEQLVWIDCRAYSDKDVERIKEEIELADNWDWGNGTVSCSSIACGKCNKELSPYEIFIAGAHQCGVESPSLMEMIIPTWPDYIELEKDLVIIEPATKIEGLKRDYQPIIVLGKGTKIYFKEEP